MNDEAEITVDSINARLEAAFQTLYPNAAKEDFIINHNDDETIDVIVPDGPTFKADIYSDDDGFLRFRPYDEDYEAEMADEDPYDFAMIRVRVM